jgi:hypothetical protein
MKKKKKKNWLGFSILEKARQVTDVLSSDCIRANLLVVILQKFPNARGRCGGRECVHRQTLSFLINGHDSTITSEQRVEVKTISVSYFWFSESDTEPFCKG